MKTCTSRIGLILLVLFASQAVLPAEPGESEAYWRATNLLESTAVSTAGEPLGDVEELVLGEDGEIYAVLVNRDLATIASEANEPSEPVEEGSRRSMYEEMLSASFAGASFEPRKARLQLADETRRVYGRDDRELPPVGRFFATRIIGVPVNLADEAGFGKVADILIRPGSAQAAGILVETGLLGGEEFVLPPEFAAFDRDSGEMNFSVSKDDLERQ